jgi:hypothetical protein
MSFQTHFEMHFQNEYQASVLLQTNTSGSEKNFQQLLLFSYIACRQLYNLRQNKVATSLAEILLTLYTGNHGMMLLKLGEEDIPYYIPFLVALENSSSQWSELIRYVSPLKYYHTVEKLSAEQIAQKIFPNVPKVISFNGVTGQKIFSANLEYGNKFPNFDLQTKGFGIFGKGINYYAPMSVILMFKHLYSLHDDWETENSGFRKALIKIANLCGDVFLQGKISAINQTVLPLEIVKSAMA